MDVGRILNSEFFQGLRQQAARLVQDAEGARQLLEQALARTLTLSRGPLLGLSDRLFGLFRMLQAYFSGRYQHLPVQTIIAALAGLLYFLIPMDAIPDFIAGLGYVDDAAVLAFMLRSLQGDLDQFLSWEKRRD